MPADCHCFTDSVASDKCLPISCSQSRLLIAIKSYLILITTVTSREFSTVEISFTMSWGQVLWCRAAIAMRLSVVVAIAVELRDTRARLVVTIDSSTSGVSVVGQLPKSKLEVVGATLTGSKVAELLLDVIIEPEPPAVIAMPVSCFHPKQQCPGSEIVATIADSTKRLRLARQLEPGLPSLALAAKFDPNSLSIRPFMRANVVSQTGGTPRIASAQSVADAVELPSGAWVPMLALAGLQRSQHTDIVANSTDDTVGYKAIVFVGVVLQQWHLQQQEFVATISATVTGLRLIRVIVKAARQLVLIGYLQIIAGMPQPLIVTSFAIGFGLGNCHLLVQ